MCDLHKALKPILSLTVRFLLRQHSLINYLGLTSELVNSIYLKSLLLSVVYSAINVLLKYLVAQEADRFAILVPLAVFGQLSAKMRVL